MEPNLGTAGIPGFATGGDNIDRAISLQRSLYLVVHLNKCLSKFTYRLRAITFQPCEERFPIRIAKIQPLDVERSQSLSRLYGRSTQLPVP